MSLPYSKKDELIEAALLVGLGYCGAQALFLIGQLVCFVVGALL